MPTVAVKTATGVVNFDYTISTPNSMDAETIDESLPTVVFIHPILFTKLMWHCQFADPLLRRFNLVAFDLRFHGKTGGPRATNGYGQVEAAEEVAELMATLKLPPCHIAAVSSATTVATQIAVSYPERVLSLFLMSQMCIEELPEAAEGHQEWYERWVSAYPDPHVVEHELLMEACYGVMQYNVNNNITPMMRAMIQIAIPECMNNWHYGTLDIFRMATFDFLHNRIAHSIPSLSRISGPVKLVYGEDDLAYPLSYTRKFQRQLNSAGVKVSLSTMPDATHLMCIDRYEQVDRMLHGFVVENTQNEIPSAPGEVTSPWEADLRAVGWNPEGDDEDGPLT